MMEIQELEHWLKREVVDDLAVGPVGIYELLWTLNSSDTNLTESQKLSLSRRVAEDLIETGQVRLHWLTWPNNDSVSGPLESATLYDDSVWPIWPDEPSSPYLALVPSTRQ